MHSSTGPHISRRKTFCEVWNCPRIWALGLNLLAWIVIYKTAWWLVH
jgi:hypothetical protein